MNIKHFRTYLWIRRVIYSCKTIDQTNNSINLINNYAKLFGKDKNYKALIIRVSLLQEELIKSL